MPTTKLRCPFGDDHDCPATLTAEWSPGVPMTRWDPGEPAQVTDVSGCPHVAGLSEAAWATLEDELSATLRADDFGPGPDDEWERRRDRDLDDEYDHRGGA